ncbi:MAG: CPBP family intramembrane metalloprotease [Bacteroidales bacterium]|nr:CPBP family intramembrane metalloprotease [Candidatus Colimorpha onthohippi]
MRIRIVLPVVLAALLWFYMFSPWTAGLTNFWVTMAVSGLLLSAISVVFGREWVEDIKGTRKVYQVLCGLGIALLLWILFWVGNWASNLLFGFAKYQITSIYAMKVGLPSWLIALLLLLVIGPAEELFWRGYVQRTLVCEMGKIKGFVITTAVYTLIHVWSFNFMLIMAALVCGVIWGGLYLLRPKWFLALVLSHAVWDACVFVVFPIV